MFSLDYVHDIISDTDHVCKDFNRLAYEKRGFYVLRMSHSKTWLKVINGFNDYLQSDAHRHFFNDIMNFPINENLQYDNDSTLKLIAYKSPRHGTVKLDD